MSLRIQVPWHHFARSAEGYATVAAAAQLSAGTISRLERFGWGQPADVAYYRHIGDEPAFWIEPVGARVAITRVLEGARDPAGRRTLAFHSILPTIAEYEQLLRAGLAETLRDQEIWAHQSPGPVVIESRSSTPPAAEPSPFLRRLLRRFENRPSGGALVVAPGAVSFDLLLEALHRLPTDQLRRSRIAYLAASNALEADLVILAPGFSSEPAQIARQIWNGSSEAPTAEMGRVSIPTGSIPFRSSGVAWPPRPPHQRFTQDDGELRMDTKVTVAFAGIALLIVILGAANLMVTSNQVQSARDAVQSARDEIQRLDQESRDIRASLEAADGRANTLTANLGSVAELVKEAKILLDGINKRLAKLEEASTNPKSQAATSTSPAAAADDSGEKAPTEGKEDAGSRDGELW